ncbi:ATPase [Pedobacter sp. HMF7647]|uniref:ATPase n=1 Tax=Hufsiella arboris TaxID=2695275 RepID=A0A7K1Y9N5_9SPHI|nr:sensor histidine kinase [Hufsiella arboris]MXV51295.1 ATPase [Hufsiella arboris]
MGVFNPFCRYRKLAVTALFFAFCHSVSIAQRFNFSHYDIEDGLIQSQVKAFAQSPSHHLWMATQGGVSRFDGSQFFSLTRTENNLAGSGATAIATGDNGKIYIGTLNGLSVYDGLKIQNYRVSNQSQASWVTKLINGNNGNIYGLINNQIFTFSGSELSFVKQRGIPNGLVTALTISGEGKLVAAVYDKGIFELNRNQWIKILDLPAAEKKIMITSLLFDRAAKDKLWVMTPRRLYISENNLLRPYQTNVIGTGNNFMVSIMQDEKSNLWIGANSGAYYIEPQKITFFNSGNGFTDNMVNQIFKDTENNVWFGTEGAGIYKYDGDRTMILDKGQGLSNEVVMGFAKDKSGNFWIHSYGKDLLKIKNGEKSLIKIPVPDSVSYGILHLFNDRAGNIWIGTLGAGLWKYDGGAFKSIPFLAGTKVNVIRQIIEDKQGTIWFATPKGCYIMAKGKFSHIKNFNFPATSLAEIGIDSVLAISPAGKYLIIGKNHEVKELKWRHAEKAEIYSMLKLNDQVFLGTGDEGIWIWNLKDHSFKNLTAKQGLYSNTIYSLTNDENGTIWAGTGRGINKIKINPSSRKFTISGAEKSKRLVVECNQNAVYQDGDKLWFGTTKGAVTFELNPDNQKKERPHIVLQSVKLFSSSIAKQQPYLSRTDGYILPKNLELEYRKNQLSLNFKGIYFTNPSEVLYQYRLSGIDDAFSRPTPNSSVNYQALPPGDYVFEARAFNKSGSYSDNILKFPFSIRQAFYQTIIFRLLAVLSLVLIGIGFQTYLHKRKNQRLRVIEEMKQQERLKTRRQTAEDFHDDFGNKLTRISILTDILNTKLNGEHAEERHLISQIKENASSLYRGTKDILWALDPKSDNLFEILSHISEFGLELFQDTAIEFNFYGIQENLSDIKLGMEFSRNISMIFKESLNNSLRHSGANHVSLKVNQFERFVEIELSDDGKGFSQTSAGKGTGLNNIAVRAKRIGAELDINSTQDRGTAIRLSISKELNLGYEQ